MSFRNNGRRRDPKYVFGAVFMIVIGILCILLAAASHFSTTWSVIVGAVITFLGILMFKNANEL